MNKKIMMCALLISTIATAGVWDDVKRTAKKTTKTITRETKKAVGTVTGGVKTGVQTGMQKTAEAAKAATEQARIAAQKAAAATKTAAEKTAEATKTAAEKTAEVAEKTGEFVKEQIIDPLISSFEKLDKWKLPDGRLRLDQVAYLGAHNAHSNLQEGFVVSQQLWNLDNQLKNGIRHFLIDIWVGQSGPDKGKLLLCHGACEAASRAQRGGRLNHTTLRTYLEKIKRFLDANPREIVTLELENYASAAETLAVIQSVPGITNYLLTPAEYDPKKNNNNWPTLNWLISKGKRLIIFDTGDPSKYGFNTNDYLIRNMYGTHDVDKACQIRNKPAGSKLFQMNYFGTVASPLPIHNTPTQLKKVLNQCQKNGVVSSGQRPNFVSLDNVHLGNAMEWVNELNKKAAQQIK